MPRSPNKYCKQCGSICIEHQKGNIICPTCRSHGRRTPLNRDECYYKKPQKPEKKLEIEKKQEPKKPERKPEIKKKPIVTPKFIPIEKPVLPPPEVKKQLPEKRILFCRTCGKEKSHRLWKNGYQCKKCGVMYMTIKELMVRARIVVSGERAQHYLPCSPTIAFRYHDIENVTIVIPTYNQKKPLLKTLFLLLPQLSRNDKIIIVDDGSKDKTKEAIERKKIPNVEIIRQKHRGLISARNKGIMAVQTTHSCANIILVTPDEKIDKNFLTRTMKGLWTKRQPPLICLYASDVHVNNIIALEKQFLSANYNVIWGPYYRDVGSKVCHKGYPNADVYVTCSSEHASIDKFYVPKSIYTPHGLSPAELECISAHKIHNFKGVLLTGKWYLDKIKQGVWNIDYKKFPKRFFRVIGWMKGDVLFSSEIDEIVENIKKRFYIKLPYEKTILYTPTGFWRMGYGNFIGAINHLIDASKYLEMNLIIKPHFGTFYAEPQKSEGERVRKLITKRGYREHITWVQDRQLNASPLYKIADVLVSDASSTLLEFLQVDKIGIEMMDRGPLPRQSIENKLEDWRGFSQPKGTTVKCWDAKKELRELLMRIVYNPKSYQPQIKKWQKKLFYKLDGRAVERAVKAVEELMGWR